MTPIVWTEQMLNTLREHYAEDSNTDIADMIGVSPNTVKTKAQELGLQKSPDFNKRKYYYRYVKNYKNKILKKDLKES